MSAAQIARIEAKRAEKAAKQAAKAAAKQDKKKGPGLGVGCAEMRRRVLQPSGVGGIGGGGEGGAAERGVSVDVLRNIDPFRTGDVRSCV